FFYASKDRSMLIPFCSKIKVAGRGLHKVLAENTTRRRGDFPDKPSGTDLGKATSSVLPLRIKREQHPSPFHHISWSIGKEAKVQRS
ncbi:hypothetical protein, partial [Prevotella bivia]